MMVHGMNGQPPRNFHGVGYHTRTMFDLYSPAAQRIFRLMGGNEGGYEDNLIYPALMASPHRIRDRPEEEDKRVVREHLKRAPEELARLARLRCMRDLIHIFEMFCLKVDGRVTLRDLVCAKQRPVELARNYFNRWQDMALRCTEAPHRNMWVSLCLHGMHMNLRMFAIGENFETLDELSRFISNVENSILRPSRGLIRRPHSMNVVSLVTDSDFESDSEDANMGFTSFTSVARYEPPLHPCLGSHPIFKVEGATFVVPSKEHRRRETIRLPMVLSHSCVGLPFSMRSLSSALLYQPYS